jgi:hypothetical protein
MRSGSRSGRRNAGGESGRDDEVYVRVLVCCCADDDNDRTCQEREYTDCPVRVWLKQPLGERTVIDVDSDDELPLYVPRHLDSVHQPGHGYHPVTGVTERIATP